MHLEVAPTPSDSSAARIRQRIRRVKRAGYDIPNITTLNGRALLDPQTSLQMHKVSETL